MTPDQLVEAGLVEQARENLYQAEVNFRQARQLDPNHIKALTSLVQLVTHHLSELQTPPTTAIKLRRSLRKALDKVKDPQVLKEAALILHDLRVNLQEFEGALEALEIAAEQDPKDASIYRKMHKILLVNRRGPPPKFQRIILRRHEPIKDCLRKIIELDPNDTTSLLQLAAMLSDEDKEEESYKLISDTLKQRPNDPELLVALAVKHTQMDGSLEPEDDSPQKLTENQKIALSHLRRALQVDPNHAYVHLNMGIILRKSDPSEAQQHFERALEEKPEDPEIPYSIGLSHHKNGDLIGARRGYERAIQLKPDYHDAHLGLGLIFQERGELRFAKVHYTNAMIHNASSHQPLLLLGMLSQSKSDFGPALRYYGEAEKRAPKDWVVHFNLANIYRQIGDLKEYEKYRRQSVKLHPESEQMFEQLQNMKDSQDYDDTMYSAQDEEEGEDDGEGGYGAEDHDPQDIKKYELEGINYDDMESWIDRVKQVEEPEKEEEVLNHSVEEIKERPNKRRGRQAGYKKKKPISTIE